MDINKRLDTFDKSKFISGDLYLIIEKEDKDNGKSRWAWIDIDKPYNNERSAVVVYGDAWEGSEIKSNTYAMWQQLHTEGFEDYFDYLKTVDRETGLNINLRIVHKENKVDQIGMAINTKKLKNVAIYLYCMGKTINMTEKAKIACLSGVHGTEVGFGDLIDNVRVNFEMGVKLTEFRINRVISNWDYRHKTWFSVEVSNDTAFEMDAKAAIDVKTSLGNKKVIDFVDCTGRSSFSYFRSTFRDSSIYKEPTELRLKLGKKVFLKMVHDEYDGLISMTIKAHRLKPGDFKMKITCVDETENTEENKSNANEKSKVRHELYEIANDNKKDRTVVEVGNWLIRYDIQKEAVNISIFNKDYTCITV